MMRKLTVLKRMKEAINKVDGTTFGEPIILGVKEGFRSDTLCWDGPCEWAIHASQGENINTSEGWGRLPPQPEIVKVVELAKANGYYFEPESGCQLCICD